MLGIAWAALNLTRHLRGPINSLRFTFKRYLFKVVFVYVSDGNNNY